MTFLASNAFYENIKIIQETSPSTQNNFTHNTWENINYSQIDYVPASFSEYVLYDFTFFYTKDGYTGSNQINLYTKLIYSDDNGSNWYDWGQNTQVFLGSNHANTRSRSSCSVKFLLDISSSGSRSEWKGNRRLRLQGKKLSSSHDVGLHKLINFMDDSGVLSGDQYFYPSVTCTSLKG